MARPQRLTTGRGAGHRWRPAEFPHIYRVAALTRWATAVGPGHSGRSPLNVLPITPFLEGRRFDSVRTALRLEDRTTT